MAIKVEHVQKDVEKVVAKQCDRCKKEYAMPTIDNVNTVLETQEFLHIRFTGGYASVFGDETTVECDLCQHCLKSLIGEYVRCSGDEWDNV